jgi:hypothetical protein
MQISKYLVPTIILNTVTTIQEYIYIISTYTISIVHIR